MGYITVLEVEKVNLENQLKTLENFIRTAHRELDTTTLLLLLKRVRNIELCLLNIKENINYMKGKSVKYLTK